MLRHCFQPHWRLVSRRGLLLAFLLCGHFSQSFAQLPVEPISPFSVPSDSVLIANGASIGEIYINVGDVFNLSDRRENKSLYRLANKIHIRTRDYVIREQLLFRPGDLYSKRLLEETERILRNNIYLYDAAVRPIRYDANKVDIEVTTRDVWTLTGGVSFSSKGGDESYGFDIEEKNFIGLGKTVKVRYSSDEFRTEQGFEYHDPHMGHNRYQMTLAYSDNSDGDAKRFDFSRPFYSLDTRMAGGLSAYTFNRIENYYESGAIKDKYRQQSEYYNISFGLSRGLINRYTGRWNVGYTVDINKFSAIGETQDLDRVPENRKTAYPWLSYSGIVNRFIKTKRVDNIQRTEDINLGGVYDLQLGWSDEEFGADINALIFSASYHGGLRTFEKQMLLANFSGRGRVGKNFSENVIFGTEARYFFPMFDFQVFYTSINFDAGHNLDEDNQFLIGGESGLRGYPSRIQDG
ncbi:POTRA domain-containing protein, partial [Kaarinaea lacus]